MVHTSALDYSRKKTGGSGYRISRVIEEMAAGFSGGLIKGNVEFLGVIKKKLCGISRSLSFRPRNFCGV